MMKDDVFLDGREARLPHWVQDELVRLRRTLKEVRAVNDSMARGHSRVMAANALDWMREKATVLPDDARVRFETEYRMRYHSRPEEGGRHHIDVFLSAPNDTQHPDMLEIMGSQPLHIIMSSSNHFLVHIPAFDDR